MQTKKIALVTGASRGIGAGIAKRLASCGFHTIINYHTSEQKAMLVYNEITKMGGSAEIFKCDVSKSENVKQMFSYIKACYGKIDLLVNNAGISIVAPFQDVEDEDWQEIVGTNLTSAINCCRESVKLMLNCGSGKIINISSIWGLVGASQEVHYSVTKAGIIGLTKALAQELAPSNILVNAIAPGVVETDMLTMLGEETRQEVLEEIPLGKIAQVEDIVNLVEFLSSDKSNYITGQVINISGGFVS